MDRSSSTSLKLYLLIQSTISVIGEFLYQSIDPPINQSMVHRKDESRAMLSLTPRQRKHSPNHENTVGEIMIVFIVVVVYDAGYDDGHDDDKR